MKTKELIALKNKYLKAKDKLWQFNNIIINSLYDEDIRETSEFFDCEVTLMDMIEDKLAVIELKLEDAAARALTGLEAE